jgi:hypothetical protein
VTGGTASSDFPTANPLQTFGGGPTDAFVTELDSTCSVVPISTYLGGFATDQGYGVAQDGVGGVYVTGATYSFNFPTGTPFQPTIGGPPDAFVTRIAV